MSCTIPPIFSSSSFSISCFTLSFLIHLELIFVWGERQGSDFIFLHVDIYFESAVISPVYTFDNFVRYQISLVNSWLFLLFCSTSLHMCFNTSTTLFLLPHSKTYLEMRNGHFSSIVILLRVYFDVQGLCCYCCSIRILIIFPISVRNGVWILIKIALYWSIVIGRMIILTIWILRFLEPEEIFIFQFHP